MCLLTFSFYMLTQHPDVEHRLREEIFEKVGATGSPTYEQMREMKYTRAFLNGTYQYILESNARIDFTFQRFSDFTHLCKCFSPPRSEAQFSELF